MYININMYIKGLKKPVKVIQICFYLKRNRYTGYNNQF